MPDTDATEHTVDSAPATTTTTASTPMTPLEALANLGFSIRTLETVLAVPRQGYVPLPVVGAPVAAPAETDLSMCGVRTRPANLFRVAGFIEQTSATLMIDSGASSEFIDTEFARRCGLVLTPSDRTIRLADGSSAPANGQVTLSFTLTAAPGQAPVPFRATFTATPLQGYDAILGLSWLAAHDVQVGWRNRTIEIRTDGRPARYIKPVECIGDAPSAARLATITTRGVARAHRRGQIDEINI